MTVTVLIGSASTFMRSAYIIVYEPQFLTTVWYCDGEVSGLDIK